MKHQDGNVRLNLRPKGSGRLPINLKLNGALGRVLNEAMHTREVSGALGVLVEDRKLEGVWALQISAARLVPIDSPSALAPNGSGS